MERVANDQQIKHVLGKSTSQHEPYSKILEHGRSSPEAETAKGTHQRQTFTRP